MSIIFFWLVSGILSRLFYDLSCTSPGDHLRNGICQHLFLDEKNYSHAEKNCTEWKYGAHLISTNNFPDIVVGVKSGDYYLIGLKCEVEVLIWSSGEQVSPSVTAETDCNNDYPCCCYNPWDGVQNSTCEDKTTYACSYKVPSCFEWSAHNTSVVCGGHGNCISKDNCNCDVGYFGPRCLRTVGNPSFEIVYPNYASLDSEIVEISITNINGYDVRFSWSTIPNSDSILNFRTKYSTISSGTLNITAYDHWNRSSETISVKSNSTYPRILNPRINGHRMQTITSTKNPSSFILSGTVTEVGYMNKYKYEWTVSPHLSFITPMKKNLVVDNFPEVNRVYRFVLNVSTPISSFRPNHSEIAWIDVFVEHDELILSLNDSDRTVPYNKKVTIEATGIDPSQTSDSESFSWGCSTSAPSGCSLLVHNTPRTMMFLGQDPNYEYVVAVNYTKGSRRVQKTVVFETSNINHLLLSPSRFYPRLLISSPKPRSYFHPGKVITLQGSILGYSENQMSSVRSLRLFWNSSELDLAQPSVVIGRDRNSPYLIIRIPKDYNRTTLKFRFSGIFDGATYATSLTLLLDPYYESVDSLRSGSVRVSPVTGGTMILTEYSIYFSNFDCFGLSDLQYSLTFQNPCCLSNTDTNNDIIRIFSNSPYSTHTFRVPLNGTLNFTASVSSPYGSTLWSSNLTLDVLPIPPSNFSLFEKHFNKLSYLSYYEFRLHEISDFLNFIPDAANTVTNRFLRSYYGPALYELLDLPSRRSTAYYCVQDKMVLFLSQLIDKKVMRKNDMEDLMQILRRIRVPHAMSMSQRHSILNLLNSLILSDGYYEAHISSTHYRDVIRPIVGSLDNSGPPRPSPKYILPLSKKVVSGYFSSLSFSNIEYNSSENIAPPRPPSSTTLNATTSTTTKKSSTEYFQKLEYFLSLLDTKKRISYESGKTLEVSFNNAVLASLPSLSDRISLISYSYTSDVSSASSNRSTTKIGLFSKNSDDSDVFPDSYVVHSRVDSTLVNIQEFNKAAKNNNNNNVVRRSNTVDYTASFMCRLLIRNGSAFTCQNISYDATSSFIYCMCPALINIGGGDVEIELSYSLVSVVQSETKEDTKKEQTIPTETGLIVTVVSILSALCFCSVTCVFFTFLLFSCFILFFGCFLLFACILCSCCSCLNILCLALRTRKKTSPHLKISEDAKRINNNNNNSFVLTDKGLGVGENLPSPVGLPPSVPPSWENVGSDRVVPIVPKNGDFSYDSMVACAAENPPQNLRRKDSEFSLSRESLRASLEEEERAAVLEAMQEEKEKEIDEKDENEEKEIDEKEDIEAITNEVFMKSSYSNLNEMVRKESLAMVNEDVENEDNSSTEIVDIITRDEIRKINSNVSQYDKIVMEVEVDEKVEEFREFKVSQIDKVEKMYGKRNRIKKKKKKKLKKLRKVNPGNGWRKY